MLVGYSARSTKIRGYSTRITKKHTLNVFIAQEVLKGGRLKGYSTRRTIKLTI